MISTSKSPDRKTENGVAAQLPEPSEHERKAIAVATTSRAKRTPARGSVAHKDRAAVGTMHKVAARQPAARDARADRTVSVGAVTS